MERKKEKGADKKNSGRGKNLKKEKEKESEKKERKGREKRGMKVIIGKEEKIQLATGECER
jgi:hypothetical protein